MGETFCVGMQCDNGAVAHPFWRRSIQTSTRPPCRRMQAHVASNPYTTLQDATNDWQRTHHALAKAAMPTIRMQWMNGRWMHVVMCQTGKTDWIKGSIPDLYSFA